MKIVFVCTGNTCRSPMMQHMFADYARKVGFGCETASAGMKGGGSAINPKAAYSLSLRGIDAGEHVSSVFGDRLAAEADFVFTMTEEQRDELRARYPRLNAVCLSDFCGHDVADPYGLDQAAYDATADLFEEILPAVLDYVEAHPRNAEKDA